MRCVILTCDFRELGGASVVDITNFIADNYPQVLSQKTRYWISYNCKFNLVSTWRNSVAGCLSANRRRIFVKLPVKKGAKRYIWKLRDMITNEDNLEDDDEEIDERVCLFIMLSILIIKSIIDKWT